MRAPFLCRGTDACRSNRRKQDRNGTASAIGRAYLALPVQSAPGFDVYPREIDEVLYANPNVHEAAAVGVPDDYRGEIIKAVVVLKPDATASDALVARKKASTGNISG